MSELAAFLLARIADDVDTARAALAPSEMHPYGDERLTPMTREQVPDAVRGYLGGPWGEHFARHDPARVLAECEAKRRIVEDVTGGWYDSDLEVALLALAQPFADHSDFRDEWRLDAPERNEP